MDYFPNKEHKSIQLCKSEKQQELASYKQDYWQKKHLSNPEEGTINTKLKYMKSFL